MGHEPGAIRAYRLLMWGEGVGLSRLSSQTIMFVIGTLLFGRMQGTEGVERALGMFINTLPIRVTLGGNGVADCLRQTHGMLTDLLHHEHASLALAQRCSALPKLQQRLQESAVSDSRVTEWVSVLKT
ncbi:hypothetical protein KGQ96_09150 [Halomonas coralii]|nr:hypothetical protein [Modicisalibacter sp. R2A 31.J]MBZ9573101.1 hypothetical protein [Modicisalibacter sp. MOD 31.J]